MPSSGTYTFQQSNSGIVTEAFDRIGKRPPQIDRHMLNSARASLNLEMIEFENQGFNFWKTTSGTIQLEANRPTYPLPANLVTVEEVFYSAVNAGGPGVNQDRFLVPMTRTDYAQIVNKLQQGIPTRYWYQMLTPPQMTIWMVPQPGQVGPNFVIGWYGLQQMQDANLANGETPDLPRRALETMIAKMTVRLAEKFGPADPQARQEMMTEKVTLADAAWNALQRRDQEPGNITFRPNVGAYGRLGDR